MTWNKALEKLKEDLPLRESETHEPGSYSSSCWHVFSGLGWVRGMGILLALLNVVNEAVSKIAKRGMEQQNENQYRQAQLEREVEELKRMS
jgi:hypothetical protein